jgi:hypothetical protein
MTLIRRIAGAVLAGGIGLAAVAAATGVASARPSVPGPGTPHLPGPVRHILREHDHAGGLGVTNDSSSFEPIDIHQNDVDPDALRGPALHHPGR